MNEAKVHMVRPGGRFQSGSGRGRGGIQKCGFPCFGQGQGQGQGAGGEYRNMISFVSGSGSGRGRGKGKGQGGNTEI